jgi:integrase
MARTFRNQRLDSRDGRLKLEVRREPHWVKLAAGWHLGYRKIANGRGTWVARYRPRDYGKRLHKALGQADDTFDADGVKFLSFADAQKAAEKFFRQSERDSADDEDPHQRRTVTVSEAIEAYLENRRIDGRGKSIDNDRAMLAAHVLPTFGDMPVSELKARKLKAWLRGVVTSPARRGRTGRNGPRYFRDAPTTEDELQKRRSTANRILATFKAALKFAHKEYGVADDAWSGLERFGEAEGKREQHLSEDEMRRLVNAASGDARDLITAALLTGARYGELSRLKAKDFDPDTGTLHIHNTKSRRVRHIALADDGVKFFIRLRKRVAPDALMLTCDGGPWTKSRQDRPLKEACIAGNVPRLPFHCLRHTYASQLVMKGVPLVTVAAQLGHSSVKVTEKHYAHLSPGFVASSVRDAIGSFGIVADDNVTEFKNSRMTRG